MSFLKYIKNQYIKPSKYYKRYNAPFFNVSKFIDYMDEYDKWVYKLPLPKNLKILDIGSDYGSLYYYLQYHNYNIIKYKPYDYIIFNPFENFNEIYENYNFIKIDCEGCEFEIFKNININSLNNDTIYAIAIHKNKNYDEEVFKKIQSFCKYKIFSIGNEEIYTNKVRGEYHGDIR